MLGSGYVIEIYLPTYNFETNTLGRRKLDLNNEVLKLYGNNMSDLQLGDYASAIHVVDKNTQSNDLCNPHILSFIFESDDKVKDVLGNVYDVEYISNNPDYLFKVVVRKFDNSEFVIKNFGLFAHSINDMKVHPKNILLKGFKQGDKEWKVINGINNMLTFDVEEKPQKEFEFYFTITGKKISNESEVFGLSFLLEV